MPIDKKIIQEMHKLNQFVHENSVEYYHTRPVVVSKSGIVLPSKSRHSFDIVYDLKDVLFIGAITENPVLLTGGTDIGKTILAKLMMNGLFGKEEEGWHRLDFDLDFGKDAYTNVKSDFFHETGKSLDDLYQLHDWMRLPGFIADELNRTHAKIAAKALHIIQEKDVTLPNGKREKVGYPINGNGTTYQYQVATINEGKDYAGVFEIDKALRRRTTIEIPMDIFPSTSFDRLLIQKNGLEDIELKNGQNNLETVLKIFTAIGRNLSLHPTAEMFVAYLEAFDYCKNSLSGEKGGLDSRNGSLLHVCTQPVKIAGKSVGDDAGMSCEFIKSFEDDLCAYVRGITPGISKNLISVARGFSMLRASKFVEMIAGFSEQENQKPLSYIVRNPKIFGDSLKQYTGLNSGMDEVAKAAVEKYLTNLEVEREDVEAAIGFVGYSKIGIAWPWVITHYQGNRYEAVKHFTREALNKFEEGLARPELEKLSDLLDGNVSTNGAKGIEDYCKNENPWLWRVIAPYLKDANSSDMQKKIETLYEA